MKIEEYFDTFIQMEHDAAKLYKDIANTSKETAISTKEGEANNQELEAIAKAAIELSKEELKHVHVLQELKKVDEISQIEINDKLKYIVKEESSQPQHFNTLKDFFTFALQCEKDTIILYNEIMLELTDKSEALKAFQILIDEERKHMHLILSILHR